MLVVFPLGLLGMSVVFDIVGLASGLPLWGRVAYWNIAGGIVSGLVAGAFGLADYVAIPSGTRAKRVGLAHALSNVAVLSLFATSFGLRAGDGSFLPGTGALLLSLLGLAAALVGGFLGGELVDGQAAIGQPGPLPPSRRR